MLLPDRRGKLALYSSDAAVKVRPVVIPTLNKVAPNVKKWQERLFYLRLLAQVNLCPSEVLSQLILFF